MTYTVKAAVAPRLRSLVACNQNGVVEDFILGGAFAKGSGVTDQIARTWDGSISTHVFETLDSSDDGGCTWTAGNGPQCLTTGGNYTTIVHIFGSVLENAGANQLTWTGAGESANPYNIRLYMGGGGGIAPYYGTTWFGVSFTENYDTPAAGALIALGRKSDGHGYGYYGPEGGTVVEEDLGVGFSDAAFDGRYANFSLHPGSGDPDFRTYARHWGFAVFNDQPVTADLQSMLDDPISFFFDVSASSAVPVLMHHYH
jgi:hypothetical protein